MSNLVPVGVKYEHIDLDAFKKEDEDLIAHFEAQQKKMEAIAIKTGQSIAALSGGISSKAASNMDSMVTDAMRGYAKITDAGTTSAKARERVHKEVSDKAVQQSREATQKQVEHIKSLAELEKEYASRGTASIREEKAKRSRLLDEERRLRTEALLRGDKEEADKLARKIQRDQIELKSINTILAEHSKVTAATKKLLDDLTKEYDRNDREREKSAAAKAKAEDAERQRKQKEEESSAKARERVHALTQKQIERDEQAGARAMRQNAAKILADQIADARASASHFRTFQQLEAEYHGVKTKKLVSDTEKLVIEKRKAEEQIAIATRNGDAVAAASAEARVKSIGQELRSLYLLVKQRSEVQHEGAGVGLGILGTGREGFGEAFGALPGIGKLAQIATGAGAIALLTEGGKKLYEVLRKDEGATDQLYISLSRILPVGAGMDREYDRLLHKSSKLADQFAMDNGEVTKIQGTVIQLSGVVGKELDNIVETSIAVGKAADMDAQVVARLISKATDPENMASLEKLGIHIEKNASRQEVMNELVTKFGPQIEVMKQRMEEGTHSFDRLTNATDDAIKNLANPIFREITPLIEKLTPKVGELGQEFGKELIPYIQNSIKELKELYHFAQDVGNYIDYLVAKGEEGVAEVQDFMEGKKDKNEGFSWDEETAPTHKSDLLWKRYVQHQNEKALRSMQEFDKQHAPSDDRVQQLIDQNIGKPVSVGDNGKSKADTKSHMAAMREIIIDAYSKLTQDYIAHIKDLRDLNIVNDQEEIASLRAKYFVVNSEAEANVRERLAAEEKNYREKVRIAKDNGEKIDALTKEHQQNVKKIEDGAYVDRLRAAADLQRAINEITKRAADELKATQDEDFKAASDQNQLESEQRLIRLERTAALGILTEKEYQRLVLLEKAAAAEKDYNDAKLLESHQLDALRALNNAKNALYLYDLKNLAEAQKKRREMQDDIDRRHIEATRTGYIKELELENLKFKQSMRDLHLQYDGRLELQMDFQKSATQLYEEHYANQRTIDAKHFDDVVGFTESLGAAFGVMNRDLESNISKSLNAENNFLGAFLSSTARHLVEWAEKTSTDKAFESLGKALFGKSKQEQQQEEQRDFEQQAAKRDLDQLTATNELINANVTLTGAVQDLTTQIVTLAPNGGMPAGMTLPGVGEPPLPTFTKAVGSTLNASSPMPDVPAFAADDPKLWHILTDYLGVNLASYGIGASRIDGDQLAIIHDGESVLTPDQAELWRQMMAGAPGSGAGFQGPQKEARFEGGDADSIAQPTIVRAARRAPKPLPGTAGNSDMENAAMAAQRKSAQNAADAEAERIRQEEDKKESERKIAEWDAMTQEQRNELQLERNKERQQSLLKAPLSMLTGAMQPMINMTTAPFRLIPGVGESLDKFGKQGEEQLTEGSALNRMLYTGAEEAVDLAAYGGLNEFRAPKIASRFASFTPFRQGAISGATTEAMLSVPDLFKSGQALETGDTEEAMHHMQEMFMHSAFAAMGGGVEGKLGDLKTSLADKTVAEVASEVTDRLQGILPGLAMDRLSSLPAQKLVTPGTLGTLTEKAAGYGSRLVGDGAMSPAFAAAGMEELPPNSMLSEDAIAKAERLNAETEKTRKSIKGTHDALTIGKGALDLFTKGGTKDVGTLSKSFLGLGKTVLGILAPEALPGLDIISSLIPGFYYGDYSGPGDPTKVAGVVHKKEFIFDHESTDRIGVNALRALKLGNPYPVLQSLGGTPQVSLTGLGPSFSTSIYQQQSTAEMTEHLAGVNSRLNGLIRAVVEKESLTTGDIFNAFHSTNAARKAKTWESYASGR